MDNVTNHTLRVGGDFVHPHLYTPSCSCGWRGEPVVSERTAWNVAADHARGARPVFPAFGAYDERDCDACDATGTDVISGAACTYCHGQGRI